MIGQDHALLGISERIRTARAQMDDPGKPIGVFLLVGPSGVGKTETALALSDLLYGGEHNLIAINMSEYQEAHTVSSLKGSPPGYVGYGEGGVLTEAVRRKPYSVVLLDEVEKAHPDVLELFFQVFDKGKMEDGEGREIDFKNTIIILTSNAGTDTLMKLTADPETMPGPQGLVKSLKPELDKIFKPAFLGRLVTIPYFPIRDEALKTIVGLKLNKIKTALGRNARHRLELAGQASRGSRLALHRGRERRPQRRQHPDEYVVAGGFERAAWPDGGGQSCRRRSALTSARTARSVTSSGKTRRMRRPTTTRLGGHWGAWLRTANVPAIVVLFTCSVVSPVALGQVLDQPLIAHYGCHELSAGPLALGGGMTARTAEGEDDWRVVVEGVDAHDRPWQVQLEHCAGTTQVRAADLHGDGANEVVIAHAPGWANGACAELLFITTIISLSSDGLPTPWLTISYQAEGNEAGPLTELGDWDGDGFAEWIEIECYGYEHRDGHVDGDRGWTAVYEVDGDYVEKAIRRGSRSEAADVPRHRRRRPSSRDSASRASRIRRGLRQQADRRRRANPIVRHGEESQAPLLAVGRQVVRGLSGHFNRSARWPDRHRELLSGQVARGRCDAGGDRG